MVAVTDYNGFTDDHKSHSIERETTNSYKIAERQPNSTFQIHTFFFAFLIILSQVGQRVTLPLWIDSAGRKGTVRFLNISTTNSSSSWHFKPFMDQYFILIFSAFSFTIFFGIALAVKTIIFKTSSFQKSDRRISHKQICVVGAMSGISAIFIVFAASGTKTPPYLQAILTNISIPSTVLLRFLLLKKRPTRRKLICAIATVLSLFVCLIPSIFPKMDPKHKKDREEGGGARGLTGVLWPLCFMLGYVLSSLANVIQENLLQFQHSFSKTKVDLLYIMFLVQTAQFGILLLSFWVDAIPFFGSVDSIQKVASNCLFGVRCSFGYNGCTFYPGFYGCLFILFFCLYVIGSFNILRYCEGATFLTIILSVVTPLGFLFWTLFKEQPSFHWHPQLSITTWLNIAGLVVMVPSIYFYNTGEPEESGNSSEGLQETSPLLTEPIASASESDL